MPRRPDRRISFESLTCRNRPHLGLRGTRASPPPMTHPASRPTARTLLRPIGPGAHDAGRSGGPVPAEEQVVDARRPPGTQCCAGASPPGICRSRSQYPSCCRFAWPTPSSSPCARQATGPRRARPCWPGREQARPRRGREETQRSPEQSRLPAPAHQRGDRIADHGAPAMARAVHRVHVSQPAGLTMCPKLPHEHEGTRFQWRVRAHRSGAMTKRESSVPRRAVQSLQQTLDDSCRPVDVRLPVGDDIGVEERLTDPHDRVREGARVQVGGELSA